MAQPANTAYSVAEGQPIHGGRWPGGRLAGDLALGAVAAAGSLGPPPSQMSGELSLDPAEAAGGLVVAPIPQMAMVGDSLTDFSFGLSTAYWMNGANGAPLQIIANAGVSGNTIQDVINRIDNTYTEGSSTRGLSGLTLGWVICRIGTNDLRAGLATATYLARLATLHTKLAAHATRVIYLAVPPLDTASNEAAYNAGIAAFCVANPSTASFIDDCVNLRDGSRNQIGALFNVDGIHFNNAGTMQGGLDGAVGFAALLTSLGYSYASPLSTDAADVYPAQPQWLRNPTITGTAGTKGSGITGTVASFWDVSASGAGTAVCSIEAADVGDANQTPWQRVTINTGASGGGMQIKSVVNGRSITATDPSELEIVIEVRLNTIDTSKASRLRSFAQGGTGEVITKYAASLLIGGVSPAAQTAVLRHKFQRGTGAIQAAATFWLILDYASAFTSSIGSIDFRCATLRG
jgi:lysophospholipase L1-like esterase